MWVEGKITKISHTQKNDWWSYQALLSVGKLTKKISRFLLMINQHKEHDQCVAIESRIEENEVGNWYGDMNIFIIFIFFLAMSNMTLNRVL